MNTKVALGVCAVVIVLLAVLFFVLTPKPVPFVQPVSVTEHVSTNAPATTSPTKPNGTTGLDVKVGPTTVKPANSAFVSADRASLTITSARAPITGTANVPAVSAIIKDSTGKALEGTSNIVVMNGHWSYSSPLILAPGNYTLELYGGAKTVIVPVVVQ